MGEYYTIKDYGLIRTIARAYDLETQKWKIMFACIGDGGLVSEPVLIEESKFAEARSTDRLSDCRNTSRDSLTG